MSNPKCEFNEGVLLKESLQSASLVDRVQHFAERYMDQFDASHNSTHIQRVLKLARKLAEEDSTRHPGNQYRPEVITLGSLLHDVGDSKYLGPGEDGTTKVEELLVQLGADHNLAAKIQRIVNAVSYSKEIKNPEAVREIIAELPELAVIQDADRLDRIGATGIAKTLWHHAAHLKDNNLECVKAHYEKVMVHLDGMMKTMTGRRMAVERIAKVR